MKSIELLTQKLKNEEIVTKKLEEWAKKKGDAPFFYYGDQDKTLTFKQFNRNSNSIGRYLENVGVKKGDKVCLYLKNQLAMALAMTGVWKIGAVFCPIDFNLSAENVYHQIYATDPKVIFTDRAGLQVINKLKNLNDNLKVVIYSPKEKDHDYLERLDEITVSSRFSEIPFEEVLQEESSNLDKKIHFSDIAGILYTSGTTGKPKGVVQSHRFISQFIYFPKIICNENDVIYNDMPLFYIGGAYYNFARAATIGCKIATWDSFNAHEFWGRIRRSGSTYAIISPVDIQILMLAEETDKDRYNTLNKLYIQPIPHNHLEIAKRFGIDFFALIYGSNELGTGMICLVDEFGDKEGTPGRFYKGLSKEQILKNTRQCNGHIISGRKNAIGVIGKPSPFFEAAVQNNYGENCQVEVSGELVFRPKLPSLTMNEYLSKPRKTLEAYKNLWFHTGDQCFMDIDGIFHFYSRSEGLAQDKGKINTNQVENFILKHPDIEICSAVIIPDDEKKSHKLILFVLDTFKEDISKKSIWQWIRNEVPRALHPDDLVLLSKIPKTPSGKIARKQLIKIYRDTK